MSMDGTDSPLSGTNQAVDDADYSSVHDVHANSVEELDDQNEAELTSKITTEQSKASVPPALDVSIEPSPPVEHVSDATSARSLPIVHISEPTSPGPRPVTARNPDSNASDQFSRMPSPSLQTSRNAGLNHDRRRSAYVDNRTANRLSGFFNNLIHRRDTFSMNSSNTREARAESPTRVNSDTQSHVSSLAPPRSITPPPPLPPPSLHELGLSMSMVTSQLSPSHFSSPPSSGTFLSPHYLLLCHSQGLDVLPLVSPPAPIPYALVRRVPFKHVVVMEQRGVLVAIAGRRDEVRVYALDEIRNAVEWRIEAEVRRERDKTRREEAKKIVSNSFDESGAGVRGSNKLYLDTSMTGRGKLIRRQSTSSTPMPRTPTSTKSKPPPVPLLQQHPIPSDPPPYHLFQASERRSFANQLVQRTPVVSTDVISRSAMNQRGSHSRASSLTNQDIKLEWLEIRDHSDEEALDVVSAGVSGSQALDERTSAMAAASVAQTPHLQPTLSGIPTSQTPSSRRRPANLDLSLINSHNSPPPQPPSPTPTLITLRQALQYIPATVGSHHANTERESGSPEPDDDDDEGRRTPTENISLVQALLESRLPNLPPVGTRRPQQPILLSSHPIVAGQDAPPSPRTSNSTHNSAGSRAINRRRRRWSVFDGIFTQSNSGPNGELPHGSGSNVDVSDTPESPIRSPTRQPRISIRSQSDRIHSDTEIQQPGPSSNARPSSSPASSSPNPLSRPRTSTVTTITASSSENPPRSRSRSRFIPRIISNAFTARRDTSPTPNQLDPKVKAIPSPAQNNATAPKPEYVKLPGTKGALLIKAVETAKKSFLAILCGEHGEKVELFAGTYRTALGLSRTFILPDSPRSLELQLQGDDLVEVFLVFSQNVFGLEPATVRVREVRIGRAERRAARRRARDREQQFDESPSNMELDNGAPEENTNVTVNVAVRADATDTAVNGGVIGHRPQNNEDQSEEAAAPQATTEELAALATAQASPYTTFQQLSFSPNFPLASIADEYVIPPTYTSFLAYRSEYEPESIGDSTFQPQLSPPGLPLPVPLPPSKWYYRDPKGVIHGPWKSSLMQAWYKDGLLPPDLPVRRQEESDYILLKDLRLQCVDPTQPFGSPPPQVVTLVEQEEKPLLKPLSLLAQPAHFGPPPLFFSSRGGHSTTIVDSRGRLVLKGRFVWSKDEDDDKKGLLLNSRMGDVKRLETIDMGDRSVLIAMRQGGLEAIDLSDALLRPADVSRTLFPHFNPPQSSFSRRGPFVWKMGTPVSSEPSSAGTLVPKPSSGSRGSAKKLNTTSGKSSGRSDFLSHGTDADSDLTQDEILFLGRNNDSLYVCEKNSGSFRILQLCPSI